MPITIKRTINIEISNSRIGNFIDGKDKIEKEIERKTKNYTVKMKTSVQKSKRG